MEKKQIEKIEKSYVSVYVANDGTEFNNADECRKYEESAFCVLMMKYNRLVVRRTNEYEMFGCGCEETLIDVVKLETQKDADTLLQVISFCGSNLEKAQAATDRALAEDDAVLVGNIREWDNGKWAKYEDLFVYGTSNQIIENIKKLIMPTK